MSIQSATQDADRPLGMTNAAIAAKDAEIAALTAAKDAEIASLRAGLLFLNDLISESHGVYGWHLNGDNAGWDEFLGDGTPLRVAIDAATKEDK